MAHQLRLCITGGAQSADDSGFPGDGIADRDHKHEGNDHDHDIQKDQHHGTVAAHILARELDGLVQIPGQEVLQIDFLRYVLHQLIRELLLFFRRCRGCIIFPAVIVDQFIRGKLVEIFLPDCRNTEPDRVKHGIVVVTEECAVIGKCHQARHLVFLQAEPDTVPDRNAVIVRIHAVQDHLPRILRSLTLHQAEQIYLLPVPENAQSILSAASLFYIIIVVQRDPQILDIPSVGF